MSFDAHTNFAYSTVATAPSPASSGTTLIVSAGDGAKFPAVPFNATVWPASSQPTTANAEIVRVTAKSTDTFTITRTQESTSARGISVGDQIAATITAKTLTDIESAIAPTRQIFTASGTYTLPSGCKAILVECIGGGGQGGGTQATTTTGNGKNSVSGGGGSGAYSASLIISPSSSYTVTIGAGGSSGTAGQAGANGTDTSFGTAVVAKGGSGAALGNLDVGIFPDTGGSHGAPGFASSGTGDLKLDGGAGGGSIYYRGTSTWGFAIAGMGGTGPMYCAHHYDPPANGNFAGQSGKSYGGGGSGSVCTYNYNSNGIAGPAQQGGAGASGICIVTEYY